MPAPGGAYSRGERPGPAGRYAHHGHSSFIPGPQDDAAARDRLRVDPAHWPSLGMDEHRRGTGRVVYRTEAVEIVLDRAPCAQRSRGGRIGVAMVEEHDAAWRQPKQ